eukprot:6491458-Amphidinium_carterae.3
MSKRSSMMDGVVQLLGGAIAVEGNSNCRCREGFPHWIARRMFLDSIVELLLVFLEIAENTLCLPLPLERSKLALLLLF